MYAAENYASNSIRWLLANNASVNLQANDGQTALHFAVKNVTRLIMDNDLKPVIVLLKNGADREIRDNNGHRAIEVAITLELNK
jgi:ankyrin repeat protein